MILPPSCVGALSWDGRRGERGARGGGILWPGVWWWVEMETETEDKASQGEGAECV